MQDEHSSANSLSALKIHPLRIIAYQFIFLTQVRFALDMDVPVSKASLLLGYVSLAQSLGKVVFGKLTDNQRVHRLYLDQASLLIVSLCHTLCPLFSNYPMLVVYTIIFGFFEGCFHAMVVVISGDIVGKGNLHNALGSIYLMCSFSSIFGPPLAGKFE